MPNFIDANEVVIMKTLIRYYNGKLWYGCFECNGHVFEVLAKNLDELNRLKWVMVK